MSEHLEDLTPAWKRIIPRIISAMDSPTYMPVAIIAAMRLIARRVVSPEKIPYDILAKEFIAVHYQIVGNSVDKAYMPFFHMAGNLSIWDLFDKDNNKIAIVRNNRPTSSATYKDKGIRARLHSDLQNNLNPQLVIDAMGFLLPNNEDNSQNLSKGNCSVSENEMKLRQHYIRERRSEKIKNKIIENIHKSGKYVSCESCGFHFRTFFRVDFDFIEAHHRLPLSSSDTKRATTEADLSLLCANCHRAIHRIYPEITVEQLTIRLKNQR